MANTYCTATNSGKGFVTGSDRNLFNIEEHVGDVWVVENNNYGISWINRGGGTAKVKADAQAIVDGVIDAGQAAWDASPADEKAPTVGSEFRVRPVKYILP